MLRLGLRRFSLCALLAAAVAPAACGSSEGDATFKLEWGLLYVGGAGLSCTEAGTPTVEVLVRYLTPPYEQYLDVFDCEPHVGRGRPLPEGFYNISIRLKDASGQVVSEHPEFMEEIHSHQSTHLGKVRFFIQSFVVNWSIERNRTLVDCAAVGGHTVELVTQLATDAPVNYLFPCADGTGTTTAVLIGSYLVEVNLLDGDGPDAKVLSSTSEPTKMPMTFVATGTERAVLPTITFDVR